jgi:hypothetical protein
MSPKIAVVLREKLANSPINRGRGIHARSPAAAIRTGGGGRAFFPPLGRRSQGGGQAFDAAVWGNVPGGYRATINNLVLILMIETLEGAKNAAEIAKVPGVAAVFAASGDLGNFSGYAQGSPDYERLINVVHDAAIGAGIRLCGPIAWRDRPDFTCFQGGSELLAIARGAAADLGPLANTQPAMDIGPYAAPARP